MAIGLTNLNNMVIMVKIKQLYMFKVMTLLAPPPVLYKSNAGNVKEIC